MKRKPSGPRVQLKLVLAGDQRLAEDVILEVRALARRYGLDVPDVRVVSGLDMGQKAHGLGRSRRSPSRARRASSSRSRA